MEVVYVARRPLRLGGKGIAVGDEFKPSEFGGSRNWAQMERRGDIEVVINSPFPQEFPSVALVEEEEESSSPLVGEEASPDSDDLEELTRAELTEMLSNLSGDVEGVPGTGSNGYVTVVDLREAVRNLL